MTSCKNVIFMQYAAREVGEGRVKPAFTSGKLAGE
jgi:hypothetical protein